AASNIRRSRVARNAARVLPEPVGAKTRVDFPSKIEGHPRVWARVGRPNVSTNHSSTAGRSATGRRGEDRLTIRREYPALGARAGPLRLGRHAVDGGGPEGAPWPQHGGGEGRLVRRVGKMLGF